MELEKKHQHHHFHRHSQKHKHKQKHKRKDYKRSNVKHDKSKLCLDARSKRPSVDSSESGSPPSVEVIVVSSDTSASPVSNTFQNGSTRNRLTKLQRNKSKSRTRLQSDLDLFLKERELFKVTGVCERAQEILKRAHEIVPVRWVNMWAVDRVPFNFTEETFEN